MNPGDMPCHTRVLTAEDIKAVKRRRLGNLRREAMELNTRMIKLMTEMVELEGELQ